MTTVLLADPHQLVASAIGTVLGLESDLDIVGIVSDGREVLPIARRTTPDLVLMDAAMPGLDSILVATELRTAFPALSVMLMTSTGSAIELQRAMGCGAHGYLRKNVTPSALVAAVRQVAAGQQIFDPGIVIDAVTRRNAAATPSARELMTLRLVAAGMSNKEVAAKLCLTPGTVRNYVSSVITKTNARNRVDAVRIAREFAWI
jgi:two-component system response regulator DesR